MVSLFHKDEFGLGLQYQADKKIGVKTDNTGNVQFELSDAGLKGTFSVVSLEAKIKEAKDAADAADTKATTAGQKNTTQDTEIESLKQKVTALEAREDIKLHGAELLETTNELKLTLSDGVEFKAPLAKFVDAPKSAQEYWNEIKVLPNFKNELLAIIRGEEVQNLAGETKGYLLSAN